MPQLSLVNRYLTTLNEIQLEKKITEFDGIKDGQVYWTHPNFRRANQDKNKVLILNLMKLI